MRHRMGRGKRLAIMFVISVATLGFSHAPAFADPIPTDGIPSAGEATEVVTGVVEGAAETTTEATTTVVNTPSEAGEVLENEASETGSAATEAVGEATQATGTSAAQGAGSVVSETVSTATEAAEQAGNGSTGGSEAGVGSMGSSTTELPGTAPGPAHQGPSHTVPTGSSSGAASNADRVGRPDAARGSIELELGLDRAASPILGAGCTASAPRTCATTSDTGDGGSLGASVAALIRYLAQTGLDLLVFIAMAFILMALGTFALTASRLRALGRRLAR